MLLIPVFYGNHEECQLRIYESTYLGIQLIFMFLLCSFLADCLFACFSFMCVLICLFYAHRVCTF